MSALCTGFFLAVYHDFIIIAYITFYQYHYTFTMATINN